MKEPSYERCGICNWFELEPTNTDRREVRDGVCNKCREAIDGAFHTPSAALPDPFEGCLGGAFADPSLEPPSRPPPDALRMAVQADPGVGPLPTYQLKEKPASEQANQVPPPVPGLPVE